MIENLTCEVQALPRIPEESAQAYRDNLFFMVEQVNRIMTSRTDRHLLIGNNPVGMMLDNHKNHAVFMSNVFLFNRYELLLAVVPWVYRSYRNQGFAHAYFPAHLQAWKKVLSEHLPDQINAPLLQVYDWLLAHHEEFIACSKNTSFLNIHISAQWDDVVQRFVRAVLQGDSKSSLSISREHVTGPENLQEFYLQVIQPAMYLIGEKWEMGEISVAKEHLASATVNRILAQQYLEFMPAVEPTRPSVLVTTAANEFHEMGAQMVANTLELDGWAVQYLGANTPNQDLLDLVHEKQPFILAMSIAMPFNLGSAQQIIGHIQGWPAENRPRIMLGGLALQTMPGLTQVLGADGYARDCQQAVDLARKWYREHTA
ncbi:cobalamin-dependent protein [Desulfonatronospira sp.]|uniref:cobalamin B12-binding domain-containing protein n=2 Tax=Desulfonatronospira sp. TaxID=1962951 RepID=UPI0025BD5AA2|nr:cobalamin-dependent protein [Desulfonatronospira sp.]